MLSIKNLFLAYTKEYYTLNDINFDVINGEHIILFGEKESGKSSLIRVIAGLEKPTKGEVLILNKPIDKLDYKNDVKIGYLSSFGAFLNRKTVKQNLEYVLKIRKFNKDDIRLLVNTAISTYNLKDIADLKVKQISNLYKMKVAIARLSLRKIDFLIVDDIFENFSEQEGLELADLVKELINKNTDCTSIVAISDSKIATVFEGKTIKLKFGSVVE